MLSCNIPKTHQGKPVSSKRYRVERLL